MVGFLNLFFFWHIPFLCLYYSDMDLTSNVVKCRSENWKKQENEFCSPWLDYRNATVGTRLVLSLWNWRQEFLHCSRVMFIFHSIFGLCPKHSKCLNLKCLLVESPCAVIRGENTRKKYDSLLQKHRAHLQNHVNTNKHKRSASRALDEQQKAIIQLQSGK